MSSKHMSTNSAWSTQLQSRVQGKVISPGDPSYDEARSGYNLTVDQRPALIIMAENAADIVETVRFAGDQDLKVAVLATGHGTVRPADDGLLVNTSQMKDVRIDADSQTAWVEAGVRWGQVLEKAQAHGLAPLLGSSPGVGAIGYTLGGGIGWLARKHGLATDSVRFFELVTADGQLRRASLNENEDLFWGLRGGGGSLGIVTGMEIQLYPVSTVYGGNLVYPMEQAQNVLARYRDWIQSVPDELTSSIALMNLPDLPMVPEFLRGRSVVMVRGCYCGPIEEGEALMQSWRDWQTPFADVFGPMPFSQVATISNDPEGPIPAHSTGAWLQELSDEAIGIISRYVASQNGPPPILMADIRHAGGAIARVDPNTAAYGNREASLIMQLVGLTPTPEAEQGFRHYTTQFKSELQRYLTGTVYMNFLEGEESSERVKDGFSPEAYRRLTDLKATYDPDNRFSFGMNISPV